MLCKGCKSECPSNVDLARLKNEFLQMYHDKHGDEYPSGNSTLAQCLTGWRNDDGKVGWGYRLEPRGVVR